MMISVKEAQRKILENIFPCPPEIRSLREAMGGILEKSLSSPHPLPFFDNSAMDGYAVRAEETKRATSEAPVWLTIGATAAAGTSPHPLLSKKGAIRIFTGAMIPPGADAVVKQEEVFLQENRIAVARPVKSGENIRLQGEEIKKGDCLLKAGDRLSPAAIGLLASVGFREVPIFSSPRIGILVTGSEIVNDPESLRPGKIFDSNSFALLAAIQELRLDASFVKQCPDKKEFLRRSIAEGLSESDFLIVTGGVSIGDFDFVKEVAAEAGVEEIFWKVKQKPGKPIYFGRRGDQYLFGLPGNPASALVCFYEYVRPALLKAMGSRDPFLPVFRASLRESYSKRAGLTHFLKGNVFTDHSVEILAVTILENQGSHMMSSFAAANCLAVIPEEKEEMKKGDEVEIHLLPT